MALPRRCGRQHEAIDAAANVVGHHVAQLHPVDEFRQAVEARGHAAASVAIAWVLAQPGITSAIVGASTAEQLSAPLNAVEIDFDDELREICDKVWWSLPRRPVIEGYR